MKRRTEQIESTLARTISQILAGGLNDPRVRGLVSVTGVKLSEDRKTAVIDISVLPAEYAPLTVKALKHASQHLRMLVREKVHVRPVPYLQFRLDESLKKQAEVFALMRESLGDPETDADQPEADSSSTASEGEDPTS